MKFVYRVLSLLAFCCTAYFVGTHERVNEPRLIDPEDISAPGIAQSAQPEYDYFLAQRMFPRQSLPAQVSQKMTNSMNTFRAKNSSRSPYASTSWNLAGPTNVGGRITSIVIHPANADIVYAGAASGGVWKTTDFGITWANVFNESFSIGSLAMDPSNSSVLYVGTGEANPSSVDTYPGNGIWKSTDDGASWTSLGLAETGHIGKIVVNPLNPNTIYVAALGLYRSKNVDKGIYKTTNGGSSWSKILFADSISGGTDIQICPNDTGRLLAATFTYYRTLPTVQRGGTGSGIYLSTNAGSSWVKDTIGIPYNNVSMGRFSLDFSKSNPSIVYAIAANGGGYNWDGAYKSTDAGATWSKVFNNTGFSESQVWYNCIVKVHPTNPNLVWAGMTNLYMSNDGANFGFAPISGSSHPDYHAIEYAPSLPNRVVLGNDGGIYTSTDGGTTFTKSLNLPITQFYAGAVSAQDPNFLLGGTQDNGSVLSHNTVPGSWSFFHGGDGFYCLVDPTDSNYIYAEYQNGGLEFSTNGGGSFNYGRTGIVNTEPVNWCVPIAMDPHHPKTLYTGTDHLYRTTNNMQSWTEISPLLTYGYPGFYSTMSTIDVAPSDSNVVYAGTGDGRVWVTTNGGGTWTDIAAGLPLRWISRVTVDPFSANIAYVALSGFREYDAQGHLFRTTNFGASWTDIGTTLPDVPLNDVIVDPLSSTTLYIASDITVMMTADLGSSWSVLGSGLPDVTVHDLALHVASRTLAAFTHGRSVYTYQLASTISTVDVSLQPGWNLLSNPVQTSGNSLAALYPGSESHAFRYDQSGYHSGDSLVPGGGYWVKFPGNVSSPRAVSGFLNTSAEIPLVAGWNLIGSISTPVAVNAITSVPPGMVTSQFFSYNNRYEFADTIQPGNGYWVKSSAAGMLVLASGSAAPSARRILIVASTELPPSAPEENLTVKDVPSEFALSQNYPNPFNPATRIAYEVSDAGYVSLAVYDLLGRKVATLVDGMKAAGRYNAEWNAAGAPSGMYIYRMKTESFTDQKRMLLIR